MAGTDEADDLRDVVGSFLIMIAPRLSFELYRGVSRSGCMFVCERV